LTITKIKGRLITYNLPIIIDKSDFVTFYLNVKTEKLIWSGKSKTWSKDSKDRIINDVIKVVIDDLQNNKLISPK